MGALNRNDIWNLSINRNIYIQSVRNYAEIIYVIEWKTLPIIIIRMQVDQFEQCKKSYTCSLIMMYLCDLCISGQYLLNWNCVIFKRTRMALVSLMKSCHYRRSLCNINLIFVGHWCWHRFQLIPLSFDCAFCTSIQLPMLFGRQNTNVLKISGGRSIKPHTWHFCCSVRLSECSSLIKQHLYKSWSEFVSFAVENRQNTST